ncbi:hypothetical protein H4696_009769 [Amycolatopsis lexingtonensis]|uniref:Uncharacterized protein n=1 Tax=Amycolatopsis lexingtonensis TaxID=218822 RepID=A0ABR9IHJ8_9PSEU|nr:hypothetical protein [Amycolatopsis lexingtonensis]MBE1502669.1 hypothetical protein [Amycolatopsis lexingtonensis]
MTEPRKYPIPAPEDDSRFTFGLILDVADVLHRHGYPKITSGDDYVALQQAVFRFLYTIPPTDPAGLDPATEEC